MPSFKQISSTIRTPGFYFEVDASGANTATEAQRTLIIGQMLASGTATPGVPAQVLGFGDSKVAYGVGSMLSHLVNQYQKRDPDGEIWCLPLSDDAGGSVATATFTLTGAATAAGTLAARVNGVLTSVPVTLGQTAAQVATALAAAINLQSDLTVTAAAAAAVITLTTRFKGLSANDCDVRLNYLGSAGGEVTPAGLTVVIAPFTGGATNPSLTAGIAALGDEAFDFIVCPYNDVASLNAMQQLMSDTAGRWSWISQLFGGVFSAIRGTLGTRTAFGISRNDQHCSIISFTESPSPTFAWAANYAGALAASLKANPALPCQTLALDVLAPPPASRDIQGARNSLLYDGLATYTVDTSGTVRVDNAITTYQTNGFGQPDNSYLQVETLFTLAAVIRRFKAMLATKYARVNIADNGTFIPPGAAAVTPNMIRADLVAEARTMEGVLLDDVDAFAANVQVVRNATNRRRVDILLPTDLIKGLQIIATQTKFT